MLRVGVKCLIVNSTMPCLVLGYYFVVWRMLDNQLFTPNHANSKRSEEHTATREETLAEVRSSSEIVFANERKYSTGTLLLIISIFLHLFNQVG